MRFALRSPLLRLAVVDIAAAAGIWFTLAAWHAVATIAAFNVWFLGELWLETRNASSTGAELDRGSRHVLTAVRDMSLVLAVWLSPDAGTPCMLWYGLATFVAGLLLRFVAMQTLGRSFTMSLTCQDGSRLVTIGIYRWMRHPGYVGLLLIYVSFAMMCGSLLLALSTGSIALLAFGYRIRLEEQLLASTFGREYEAYRNRTGAMFPKLLPVR